jgi:hypothetical protein
LGIALSIFDIWPQSLKASAAMLGPPGVTSLCLLIRNVIVPRTGAVPPFKRNGGTVSLVCGASNQSVDKPYMVTKAIGKGISPNINSVHRKVGNQYFQ